MYLVYLVILFSSRVFCFESGCVQKEFNTLSIKLASNHKINKEICIYTFPKTGSGLLESALREVIKFSREFQFDLVRSEHFFNVRAKQLLYYPDRKIFMILRDPRDTALSYINFKITEDRHLLHEGIDIWEKHTELSYEKLIEDYFKSKHFNYLDRAYRSILECWDLDSVCVLQFEKLVGVAGGGSDEDRDFQVMKIAEFLNIEISDEDLKEVCQNIYGNSWTFFKGKIGKYKTVFNKQQIDIIEEKLGDLIEPLSEYYDFTR